jgi:hypothetical protein
MSPDRPHRPRHTYEVEATLKNGGRMSVLVEATDEQWAHFRAGQKMIGIAVDESIPVRVKRVRHPDPDPEPPRAA